MHIIIYKVIATYVAIRQPAIKLTTLKSAQYIMSNVVIAVRKL